MIPYVIVFIICVVGFILNTYFIKDEKTQKKIDIIILIILCLMTGTRYNIGGYDYFVYKNVYEHVPDILHFDLLNIWNIHEVFNLEKGFLLICSIVKSIGFTYYGFNLLCSIFFYFSLYKGLKKYTNNFTLLIIFFLYKLFFYNTFVLTRQMLCIGGFFLLIKFIKRKDFLSYLAGCLVLSTIHTSSLLLIPIYFVNYLKLTKKNLIIINLVFAAFFILELLDLSIIKIGVNFVNTFIPLGGRFQNYLEHFLKADSPVNFLNTLEYFTIMSLVIYKYDEYMRDDNNQFFLKIILIILPTVTLFRNYAIMARVKDYFSIFYIFVLGGLIKFDYFNKRIPTYIKSAAIIIVCFLGYIRFLYVFDNGALMPYNSYINDNVKIIDIGD